MIPILALLVTFIPAVLWLWFFYSRDRYEHEPKRLIGKLFLWGVLSGFWAAGLNDFIRGLFGGGIQSADDSGLLGLALGLLFLMYALAALNEETMKFLVTSNSVRTDPNFNEMVDGMIYMTTAALGFAAGENFGYVLREFFTVAKEAGASSAFIRAFLVLAPFRAFDGTMAHVAFSGIVGYFFAQRVLGGKGPGVILVGILAASALHATSNFVIDLPHVFYEHPGFILTYAFVGVDLIALGIYAILFRKALAASPFRTKQLAAGTSPPPGPAPKPAG
ncbi:MAG TPA: PrsW family glutamic-type intramembrane protease [bacterium]|jgi:RsiW-degrading membrane proteinase PrsW (M82 family)